MPDVRSDLVAVYVYRRISGTVEFLQLHRSGPEAGAGARGEYQHSWQTVYGGIEKHAGSDQTESAPQAALRELKEETGLTPTSMWQVEYLESFYFMPRDYVLIMPVFAAEVPPTAAITLNEEHDAFRWVPEPHIKNSFMWRTQREALQHLLTELHRPGPARPFLTIF